MTIDEKIRLVVKNTEEVILKEEIKQILQEKNNPRTYIGFELSGLSPAPGESPGAELLAS